MGLSLISMIQPISSPITPPLLLAMDGSESAHMAQQLISPIAELLVKSTMTSDRPLLTVLTVQPRSPNWRQQGLRTLTRRLSRSPVARSEDSNIGVLDAQADSTQPLEELMQFVHAELPSGLTASFELRQGRPATEILKYARSIQAGLIAVGQQGVNGVKELLLGSVSSTIARYAPSHVLIARSADSTPITHPKWQHVLLVVDQSLAAKQAIAVAHQLAPIGISQITLLCVQTPLTPPHLYGPFTTPTPNWQLNRSLQEAQKEQSEQLIQQACASLNLPDLQINPLIQTGEPGPLICQVAQQQAIDLILLGSNTLKHAPQPNHRQLLRNTRLSLTADYVIHHAPCPVLLCRTGATKPTEKKQNKASAKEA
jgi:nucleotide-binding universal stress UspA family protein